MSFLAAALELAAKGFHVFPLVPESKNPLIKDFPEVATTDPEQLKKWWLDPVLGLEQPYNIGISTTRFGRPDQPPAALVVVDIDKKEGKDGETTILALELEGCDFPETYTQNTPSGGRHLVYVAERPVRQGTGILGNGVDIRSRGGFIVATGSELAGGVYSANDRSPAPAPAWLVDRLGAERENQRAAGPGGKSRQRSDASLDGVTSAFQRAYEYLQEAAPLAIQGQGGDETTFKVACRLKDFGLPLPKAIELMIDLWNERCEPPWDHFELEKKVANAYRYGREAVGAKAPELEFEPVDPEPERALGLHPAHGADYGGGDPPAGGNHPFDLLNKEFAFVIAGGGSHILWETTGPKEEFRLEHLTLPAFHQKLAAQTMSFGNRQQPTSELWMKSARRRSYDGIVFMPGKEAPERYYNLWRGFAVEPWPEANAMAGRGADALGMFLQHARENICRGDENLFKWLMGYFAHLIQRPWEKPLVCLVFRGPKGVGKNALVDRVGGLLGAHYLLTSNRRYLIGNFNGHLENLLLFTLDEAFWSGDKQAEGTLKDLITGTHHVIEHKGKEPYTVANCTRVVIIGNEDWLVPASHDERRFAVFDVGSGRKQDRQFFQEMREGMEDGGNRLLLRYFMNHPISDVNAAPSTEALMDQKVASLEPIHQWWLECLTEGEIVGADFSGGWPAEMEKERFRSAFKRYYRDRQIRGRIPEERLVAKALRLAAPELSGDKRRRIGDDVLAFYSIPPLERCRETWQAFIGHPVAWKT